MYLELVFGLDLGSIWKIQVRSYSVGKEIEKSLHSKVTIDITNP